MPIDTDKFLTNPCPVCGTSHRYGTYFFQVEPESAQSLARKGSLATQAYRTAIRNIIANNHYRTAWTHDDTERHAVNKSDALGLNGPPRIRKVCMKIIFVLRDDTNIRDKDLDNMEKAFLDAIKEEPHGLITDDVEIVHLDSVKVTRNSAPISFTEKHASGYQLSQYTGMILVGIAPTKNSLTL